jgi:hypothetical protein
MKKFYIVIAFFFLVLVGVNFYYFRSLYNMQVNQQKNFLFKQSEVCVNEIEQTVLKFESDLNFILFSDDIAQLFKRDDSEGLRKLQLFYSTYNGLIKNIDIYDNNKNVLNLFRDRKLNFITDSYIAQRQRTLESKDDIIINKSEYQYILPVFKENKLFANILVTININNYILAELNKFHLDDLTWQWLIDLEAGTVINTSDIAYNWNGSLETVLDNLNNDLEGLIIHTITNDSLNYEILTVYTPVKILNRNFGIAFSVDHHTFLVSIYEKLFIIAGFSLLIFLFVSAYLLYHIKTLKKKIAA